MTEPRRYDVDWSDEDNPRIVIAQPGDDLAMTHTEAQQVIDDDRAEQ
ncbi:hypothetical protein [Streptomyces sp. NBC_01022]|nr:hypothetical protein [Streptomyces sp. NBC_01022]WRZ84868.1 hypothetical protein OG316_33700 [Streptomyces sp. NBC_01022]